LDPSKVYFSPRLSQEHRRIAQQVKDRELIVDMFAGVGPFAIQIAKTHKTVTVYAIDLNPDAINFLNKNVSVNNVEGKVIPVLGDARTVIEERLTDVANRVIMNLPERAVEFIDSACKSLKADGGIIHYYSFESEPNVLEKATEKLTEAVIDSNRRVERILSSRLVRPVAPHEWQIGIDAILR